MPAELRVLLADGEGERAALLEQRLREISDAVILRVPPTGDLVDAVGATAPDVIIVDMARPDRDVLDDLRRVSADNPRAVVMFVDRDDRTFMDETITAGVSSYNVVTAAFPDVKPIVMAAVAIFRRYQRVADDLREARASLTERATIDRAKAMLMKERNFDEPQAHRWLRFDRGHAFDLAGWTPLPSGRDTERRVAGLLDAPPEPELVIYADPARGAFRYASLIAGRLDAFLFIARAAAARGGGGVARRPGRARDARLPARRKFGRPGGGRCRRTICACFGIGLRTLHAEIASRRLTSLAEIDAALRAGTNCGSCVPELRAILRDAGAAGMTAA